MHAVIKFLALLFTALALVPSGAHLMELLNKMQFSSEQYLIAQQIYRGWSLSAILVFGAMFATLALLMALWKNRGFAAAAIAFACIVGTQLVFWTKTYPVNVITNNWTVLPDAWQQLRAQWEYSHALSALLNLVALCAAIVAVLKSSDGGAGVHDTVLR
jgi:hypothetical protein